jgi:hypothetical protein
VDTAFARHRSEELARAIEDFWRSVSPVGGGNMALDTQKRSEAIQTA